MSSSVTGVPNWGDATFVNPAAAPPSGGGGGGGGTSGGTSPTSAPAEGNIHWRQLADAQRHGAGAVGQSSDGTGAPGNLSKYNADGTLTDNGICYSYGADTGTANAYAVTLTPTPTIVAGSTILFVAANANTGASTLSVNGTSYPLVKNGTGVLASGDIAPNQVIRAVADGTGNFQISALPSTVGRQGWIAYDLGGKPPAGTLTRTAAGQATFVPIPGNLTTFQIPANFTGAQNTGVDANPTASAVYTFYKSGTSCGTLTISTSGTFTWATTGGLAISFTPGTDVLAWIPPATQDATLSGVRFAIPVVIS